ncbi:MAG TPA: hypothetical protein ENH65_06585, partial [Candidatus Aminicenantes bacterium]|nr:hypothetical protein [Candidatus Aminicenantes bacterium]
MQTVQLIKSKETYDPSKVSDKVLLDDHRIAEAWWSTIRRGGKIKGWSQEDVYNAHKLIVGEMRRRGLKHKTPLLLSNSLRYKVYDQPIRASERDNEAKGGMLFLPSILKAFKGDFMICEDFVTVVGGLCTHGRTRGDIDILLKCKEPRDESSPLGMATKFRIARALARQNIKEDRIEYLYDDFSGPFTSHVHLYDLVLRLKPKRELDEMSLASLADSVSPFRFVTQPKPLHGRFKEEIYSPETVAKVVDSLPRWKEALPRGIGVEKKFDGFRVQTHKVGKKVRIITEENNDVTDKLPSLVKEIQKIKHNFVAEGEAEHWMDGVHQNRADTVAIIHVKEVSPHEKHMILNFYDLLWLDGKDIHSLPFIERVPSLMNIMPDNDRLKVSKVKIVKTEEALKSEVIKASKLDGSEGAVIKMADYKYPLKPRTSQMIKFKNEFSINVDVVEVHDVKGTKAKNYLTAIRDRGKNIPMGRTYNTNIIAGVNDKIRVVFVELSKYIDPDTKDIWYNFWSPRVVE